MTTLGLVGGIGPETTVDYYRRILAGWQKYDPASLPSIVIDSLDFNRGLKLVGSDLPGLLEYLLTSINRLAAAGADVGAMAANTPHIVFDDLAARSPIPLVSIVDATAEEAKRRGLKRLALLGTRFTMEADFYPKTFARHGMQVVAPGEADRQRVHDRYVNQLLQGQFLDATRDEVRTVVQRLTDAARVDAVIMGGTELVLLLPEPDLVGLPVLDTAGLHIAALIARLRSRT